MPLARAIVQLEAIPLRVHKAPDAAKRTSQNVPDPVMSTSELTPSGTRQRAVTTRVEQPLTPLTNASAKGTLCLWGTHQ